MFVERVDEDSKLLSLVKEGFAIGKVESQLEANNPKNNISRNRYLKIEDITYTG